MPRLRSGFTLIELLVVVVVIGILAVIAIPRFSTAREKTLTSVLTSDLHNLTTAQEGYFYERRVYSASFDSLKFTASTGVTVTVHEATASGWSATAEQPTRSPRMCSVFYGTATPVAPATQEGVPACQ